MADKKIIDYTSAEGIRCFVDTMRAWQKENNGKFDDAPKFWNAFFAHLFMILYSKLHK